MNLYKLMGVVLLGITLVAGCSKGNSLQTVVTKGTITFDGKPAGPGAEVMFFPVGGNQESGDNISAETAMGKTDENGAYILTSMNGLPDKGALAGEYEVTISWRSTKEPELDPVTHAPVLGPNGKPSSIKVTDIIPAKYGKVKTSGLTATVSSGKENVIDFTLEK